MSGTITFKINREFKAVVEQARKLNCKIRLVKDHGIYLLPEKREEGSNPVAYAHGFDPKKNDCWDRAQSVMGGDDCVEYLERSTFEEIAQRTDVPSFKIRVTATRLSVLV